MLQLYSYFYNNLFIFAFIYHIPTEPLLTLEYFCIIIAYYNYLELNS